MNIILIILLFGLAAIFLAKIINVKSSNSSDKAIEKPYISKYPLTQTEAIFYHRLMDALPDFIVLAQVQLSSFIKVDQSQITRQEFYKWFTPISQQSVDYLICKKDFSIIAAIELDDKSHLKLSAIERDNKKNTNLAAAKVPLIRWHAEDMPLQDEIRQKIIKHIQIEEEKSQIVEEWILDDQEAFFNRSSRSNELLPIGLTFGAIALSFLVWGMPNTFTSSKNIATSQAVDFSKSTQAVNPNNAFNDLLEKQRKEQATREESIRQSRIAEQKIIQQQGQEKLTKVQEEISKEEMWKRYYRKSPQCETMESVVECGNEYIIKRKKFELYWKNRTTKTP